MARYREVWKYFQQEKSHRLSNWGWDNLCKKRKKNGKKSGRVERALKAWHRCLPFLAAPFLYCLRWTRASTGWIFRSIWKHNTHHISPKVVMITAPVHVKRVAWHQIASCFLQSPPTVELVRRHSMCLKGKKIAGCIIGKIESRFDRLVTSSRWYCLETGNVYREQIMISVGLFDGHSNTRLQFRAFYLCGSSKITIHYFEHFNAW